MPIAARPPRSSSPLPRYAALQLAVLAGFASSIRWARAPAWGYLLFVASLLAVGVVGWAVTVRNGQHTIATAQARL